MGACVCPCLACSFFSGFAHSTPLLFARGCWAQLDHPSVIKLYEVFEDDNNMYLVLEYCSGGELYDRLHAQDGHKYSEQQASRLVFQMLTAIAYCHFMGISHRDLKCVALGVLID